MKVAIHTLGCKVNQYETQALENELIKRGHTLGDFDEPCDAYIINTCSVTSTGDKKSRQAIRRARRNNGDALVAVCGCYAQLSPQEVRELGADLVAGTNDRSGFIALLEDTYEKKVGGIYVDDAMSRRTFEPLPAGGLAQRTRAMLKVEDGCHNFCTYCIIPYARGPVRSLPVHTAVAEALRLCAEGYREIVVTGIEISSYGKDLRDDSDLTELISRLCAAVPDMRIRLGSLEPRTVTEDFCLRLKAFDNLCSHFHLSLQSGSDETLRRMGRKYTTARYLESVKLLKTHFPGCAVTTDLIVGFPGESQAASEETLSFIQTCGFASMHIFPYSPRPGTPAASMPEQILKSEKEARVAAASAVAAQMEASYLEGLKGQTLEVLFESYKDGYAWGHAKNNVSVRVFGNDLHNCLKSVRITRVHKEYLTGESDQ